VRVRDLIQTSLLLLGKSSCSYTNYLAFQLNEKAERSVSKQGHLQPRFHSKAR